MHVKLVPNFRSCVQISPLRLFDHQSWGRYMTCHRSSQGVLAKTLRLGAETWFARFITFLNSLLAQKMDLSMCIDSNLSNKRIHCHCLLRTRQFLTLTQNPNQVCQQARLVYPVTLNNDFELVVRSGTQQTVHNARVLHTLKLSSAYNLGCCGIFLDFEALSSWYASHKLRLSVPCRILEPQFVRGRGVWVRDGQHCA